MALTDDEARRYAVVIPQPDGSLYPIRYHSLRSEAEITVASHNRSGGRRAELRENGPEIWKLWGWGNGPGAP